MEDNVIKAYKTLLEENGISNMGISINTKIGRETGLDSLGIVNFILILEEILDKSLDDVLIEIRKCQNLKQIAELLESKNCH